MIVSELLNPFDFARGRMHPLSHSIQRADFLSDIDMPYLQACRSNFPGSRGISDIGVRLATLLALSVLVHENQEFDLNNTNEIVNAVYGWINESTRNPNHVIEKSRIQQHIEYSILFVKCHFLHQDVPTFQQAHHFSGGLEKVWIASLSTEKLVSLFLNLRQHNRISGMQDPFLSKINHEQWAQILTNIDINLSIQDRQLYLNQILKSRDLKDILAIAINIQTDSVEMREIWNQRSDNKRHFVSTILEFKKQIDNVTRITPEHREEFLQAMDERQRAIFVDVLSFADAENRTAFLETLTFDQFMNFWYGISFEDIDKKQIFWDMIDFEQRRNFVHSMTKEIQLRLLSSLNLNQQLDVFKHMMDTQIRVSLWSSITSERGDGIFLFSQLSEAEQFDLWAAFPIAIRTTLGREMTSDDQQKFGYSDPMNMKVPLFLAQLNDAAPVEDLLDGSDIIHLINHYSMRIPRDIHDYTDFVTEGGDSIDITSAPSQMITDVKVQITNPDLQVYLESEGRLPLGQTIENLSYKTLIEILEQNEQDLYEEDRDFKILPGVKILIPNPDFDGPIISDEERQFISHLELEIAASFIELSQNEKEEIERQRSEYLEEDLQHGDYRMYLTVNSNVYDRSVFVDLLVALKTQNRSDFIVACNKIQTILGVLEEAKNGFISTFSHLFITHYFPSKGCKEKYYHYLLRCGQVH